MKRTVVFKDDRGDDGVAEAARFIGMYGGCVPGSRPWQVLRETIDGYDELADDDLSEVFVKALKLLLGRYE